MVVIDVFNLVTKDGGEFVFAGHQVEHAFANKHRAAGKREGVDHATIGHNIKRVRQATMSVQADSCSDTAHVACESLLFGSHRLCVARVLIGELFTDTDLLGIRKACQAHGCSREIALQVRRKCHDCVCRYVRGLMPALAEVKAGNSYEQHNQKRDGTFHSNWRILSLYRL